MEEKREEWKQKLRDAGFLEGTVHTCHFYKELTEKTAFCLNLKFHKNYTGIVYGIFRQQSSGMKRRKSGFINGAVMMRTAICGIIWR